MDVQLSDLEDWVRLVISLCILFDYSLPALFNLSGQAKCSEPVDKVHGILGLAPSSFSSKITPSYLSSPGEVYNKTFLELVNFVNRFELLEHAIFNTSCLLLHRGYQTGLQARE